MTERKLAARLASHFDSRWLQAYVRSKVRSDPVYRVVAPLLADASHPLLDLGCGVGILELYLREVGVRRQIVGIDFDERKVHAARRAAQGEEDIEYRVADIRQRIEFRGDVVMLDILHYFSDADQRVLLENAAEYAGDGGIVIIRECLRDSSWRYRLTYFEEVFATSIGWLKGERLNFPTRDEIQSGFPAFDEVIKPLWGMTPFNNHLLVFSSRSAQKSC